MSEQSEEGRSDEESLDDLEVTDEDADDVTGGAVSKIDKAGTNKADR